VIKVKTPVLLLLNSLIHEAPFLHHRIHEL